MSAGDDRQRPYDPRFVDFIESADDGALRAWLLDYRLEDHLAALGSLEHLFDALRHGEQPRYDDVDWADPHLDSTAIADIHRWITMSNKADMQTMACDMAWRIGGAPIARSLEPLLYRRTEWLTPLVLDALERIGSPEAASIVRNAADDTGQLGRIAADALARMQQAGTGSEQ